MTLPDLSDETEGDLPNIKHRDERIPDENCTTASKLSWQYKFKELNSPYDGYVDTLEDALDVLREYELQTTTKFASFKSDKKFGDGDPFTKSRKVFFKDENIPFDGMPFNIIGSKVFDCHHGPDRKKNFKRKLVAQKEANDHHFVKKKFLTQNTVKFNCPAQVRFSEVIKYPSYKIRNDTERLCRDMSKMLKTEIANGKKPKFERRIYIHLPREEDHKQHVLGEIGGILQSIDKRLVDQIDNLVGEGVKTVGEMKRHLKQFVKTEMFPGQPIPPLTNRRFHPTDVDIRNHIYKTTVKQMMSKLDQENLHDKPRPFVDHCRRRIISQSAKCPKQQTTTSPSGVKGTSQVCYNDIMSSFHSSTSVHPINRIKLASNFGIKPFFLNIL